MYISIDPGVNFCSIVVIDNSSGFKVVESNIVNNTRKFKDEDKKVEEEFGTRLAKVMIILNKIEEMLGKYEIDTLVVEAPFYNSLTPQAYGSLLEVIFAIKYKIIYERKLNFKLIEPLLVKKVFSGKSMANKLMMKEFLITHVSNGAIDINGYVIDELTEHEIDGIAIGYTYHINQGVK